MEYYKIALKDHFTFLGEGGKNPTLEAFLPYNLAEMGRQDELRPCLLICPGGGYAMCSEREAEPIALKFLELGMNVFILTYSTQPHRFPTQLQEVASVMELIYQNATVWHCDTTKIAIMGFSAGGHLAAHYSTMFDCKEVRAQFPESKSVNASVLCYPVITADSTYGHQGSFLNLLGHDPADAEVDYFSCDRNVKATTPPAFIWHTAEDACVPVENSLLYAAACSKHKVPFELHIYPNGAHGLSTCDHMTNKPSPTTEYVHQWLDAAKKWLKLTFRF